MTRNPKFVVRYYGIGYYIGHVAVGSTGGHPYEAMTYIRATSDNEADAREIASELNGEPYMATILPPILIPGSPHPA